MKRANQTQELFIISILFCARVLGQLQYTTPQSENNNATPIFNAVTASQSSGCLRNEGQTIWFSNYLITVGTATSLVYRLEYSYNSDAATCTTGTWFAMSDDATDLTQGEVVGIGTYPFVRANLVTFIGAGGGAFTSYYTTTSASPGILNGFANPSQQIRKIVFTQASTGTTASSTVVAPYASAGGMLMVTNSIGTFPGTSTIGLSSLVGDAAAINLPLFTLANAQAQLFLVPPSPCTSVKLLYTSGGASALKFSAYYIFYPPGAVGPSVAQPPTTFNSEVTSATNSSVTNNITFSSQVQRAHLYSVSARCSAGTAQLTVADASTQIWSTGTTEVGTTTFNKAWNPGLAGGLNHALNITLSACGAGNVGTLDIQGSVF